MTADISTLPDDPKILRDIISSFADTNKRYEKEIEILREQIRLLNAKLFGRKTEKMPESQVEQLVLFDVAEEQPSDIEDEEIKIKAYTRKRKGRKPLPAHLPRVEVVHDISDEEKVCECGCDKDRIGEETSEQLDIIPAKMQVIVHIRPKYACKNCEGVEDDGPTVAIAPPAVQLIPKSIASPGLLAHIFTGKFVDALPFYRQEKQFIRLGVEISRASMCSWAMKVAESCEPLIKLIRSEILSGPLIGVDETPTLVMNETGRKNTTKSYMWVFRGGPLDRPALLYEYHPTREGNVVVGFLHDYKGHVQSDGYGGYDFLDHIADIIHLGCWSHSRRKFFEVVKARKVRKGKGKKTTGKADAALGYIRVLYQIEKRAKKEEMKPEQIHILRQEHSGRILKEFKEWLDTNVRKIPPKSLLGKAVTYTLNQWPRLIGYIEKPFLKPDNNLTENAIRPYVVGRKNWLFNASPKGAEASAIFYSLIETAKANDLEPYRYLRYLFEKIPFAQTQQDYKALLPQYLDKSQLLQE